MNFLRSELDDVTPRTEFVTVPPSAPGADLLYQVSAAYAAGALALNKAGGSAQLAQRAATKATDLFLQAGRAPGLYSTSIPETAKTYPNDSWESYGLWAATWLYKMTGDVQFKTVCLLCGQP